MLLVLSKDLLRRLRYPYAARNVVIGYLSFSRPLYYYDLASGILEEPLARSGYSYSVRDRCYPSAPPSRY